MKSMKDKKEENQTEIWSSRKKQTFFVVLWNTCSKYYCWNTSVAVTHILSKALSKNIMSSSFLMRKPFPLLMVFPKPGNHVPTS